ncbi:Cyclic nucleotide-gated cation channel beta-1 [Hypsibius exemplaris]|uniref:Cyclic nucleotide-gated cation channel beta-1 n=1 Tax=Hypsibius exemplaris TaxID=2072580 RepID=A0A1W0WJB3_HYPEX|nr:Cyclic nucleotide-gated cation channel beta-1 [Hypsibius exemplaris]
METLIARRLAKQAALDAAAAALELEYESDAEIFIRQVSSEAILQLPSIKPGTPLEASTSRIFSPSFQAINSKFPTLRRSEENSTNSLRNDDRSASPAGGPRSDGALLHTKHGKDLEAHLTKLAAVFRARSVQSKSIISQPPRMGPRQDEPGTPGTPATPVMVAPRPQYGESKPLRETKLSLAQDLSKLSELSSRSTSERPEPVVIRFGNVNIQIPEVFFKLPRPPAMDSNSKAHLTWLGVVSLAFLYNAIVIPYRAAFPVHTPDNLRMWLAIDYFCDVIYLVDLLIWKAAIKKHVHGIEQSDSREIVRIYVTTTQFRLDLFSLTPLDLFYLFPATRMSSLLRLARLLRLHLYWEFMDRIDQITTNPYNFRVMRTFAYMVYIIHVNACIYYVFSYMHDFDPKDQFIYNNAHHSCTMTKAQAAHHMDKPGKTCNFPGQYNAYIFCFFFSVSMITIIGNTNIPGTPAAMVYSTVLWLVGVLTFSTIVGQIRDVLRAKTRQVDAFYEMLDVITDHMQTLDIPEELQSKVRTWLLYNWEEQGTTEEDKLLVGLPTKLRSDMAMEVHYSTIHKVQLFRHMDKKVVEDLLLRLRPTVYLPGDYICREGEVGKEMFIVKSGLLEVILPDGRLAVTLGPGSVFGEISLLAIAGKRRTATVRSKGFSNLFVLTKADLNEVMRDYPEELTILKAKAEELLSKGKPPEPDQKSPPAVEVIHSRPGTPTLFNLTMSVLHAKSLVKSHLNKPHFRFTRPDLETSDSLAESDPERMALPLYVELLRDDHGPRSSRPATGPKENPGTSPTEAFEMQEFPRKLIRESGAKQSNSMTQLDSKPRKRIRSRSRSRSPSPRNLALLSRSSSTDSESDQPAASPMLLHPGRSGRRQTTRTPPLESPAATSKSYPPTVEQGGRTKSLRTLFDSPNLQHLRVQAFRRPKISPLRVSPERHLSTEDSGAATEWRRSSGIFNLGPPSDDPIGDGELPPLASDSEQDFILPDGSRALVSMTFSSSDSSS